MPAYFRLVLHPSPRTLKTDNPGATGIFALEAVQSLEPSGFLSHIQFYLLDAGEKVYRTNNLLVEQLRRYLDEPAWLENRRILELIRGIERRAVALKDTPPEVPVFAGLDELRPGLDLVLSRNLFTPPSNPASDDRPLTEVDVEHPGARPVPPDLDRRGGAQGQDPQGPCKPAPRSPWGS
jgi:hypothetical protein